MELLVWLVIVVVLGILAFSLLGAAVQLVWALVIGAIVGFIANWIVSLLHPAGGPQGILSTTLAGIGGSFLATILMGKHGFLGSIVGAIIVVFLWKLMTAGRAVRA